MNILVKRVHLYTLEGAQISIPYIEDNQGLEGDMGRAICDYYQKPSDAIEIIHFLMRNQRAIRLLSIDAQIVASFYEPLSPYEWGFIQQRRAA